MSPIMWDFTSAWEQLVATFVTPVTDMGDRLVGITAHNLIKYTNPDISGLVYLIGLC